MKRSTVLLAAVLLLVAASAVAQNAPIVPPDSHITAYTLPADKLAKATTLYHTRFQLMIIDTVWGLVILLLFLFGRWASRFRALAERATRNQNLQALIFVPLFILGTQLLQLPVDIFHHHVSMRYGLSVQKWGSWFGDLGKGLTIELIIASLAVMGAYALMRKSPRRWWLWFWAISVPFVLFIVFIAPVVLDPIFNHFDPLEPRQPQLVAEIEKVTQHGGLAIPRSRMFEMRASEKVTTLNAYVTGIGASKRVVVWDNTIREMTTPQTLYVFGHEMGHYVMNHMWKGLAFTLVVMLIAYFCAAKFGQWLIVRLGQRWGVRAIDDYASLPALILVASIFAFLISPITSGFSRHLEHEADRYGVEVLHGIVANPQQVAAQSFQALGENSLSYPHVNRLVVFWTYSHPDIPDRIQFVLGYDPWSNGEEPKYVK
jgi:STE24 endopeptidase